VLAGMRAEDLHQTPAGEGLQFRVGVVEPLGSHLLVTGKVADQQIRIVTRPDAAIRAGDTIGIAPALERVVWMDPTTGTALEAHP
jgi:multiple sugar transport system ATP-binding protein